MRKASTEEEDTAAASSSAGCSSMTVEEGSLGKKRVRKSEVRVRDEDADYERDVGQEEDKSKKAKSGEKKTAERGIMANSDAALRRRDRIKSTNRYSPPLPTSSGRDRRKSSFPSTYSRSSSSSVTTASTARTAGKEVTTCAIDVKREADGGKMLITLPDGTTYRLDATPVPPGAAKSSSRRRAAADDEDSDDDAIIETGLDDPDDDDYEPTYRQLRRIRPGSQPAPAPDPLSSNKKTPQRRSAAVSNSIVKEIARPPRSSSSNKGEEMRTTAIKATMNTGVTKVTYVAAPKAITLTASFRQPPKRNYGIQAKFIDDLPELSDCTGDQVVDESVKYDKTPDTMLLINSDLPLQYCTSICLVNPAPASQSSCPANSSPISSSCTSSQADAATTSASSDRVYAFRQILSPHSHSYPCLLCPQRSASASKSENELKAHYSMFHELTIETATSKVSDDVVYVCLSKASLTDIESGQDVDLTAGCQYCESLTFHTLSSLKQHYESDHGNRIELIDQEMILKMHEHLYCYSCDQLSFQDFKSLNQHMRDRHGMQSFPCRSCSFFTKDEVRLKSHFKAKHMMNNSSGGSSNHMMQCTECAYCNGLLIGNERMSRHIMTAHCIQTSVGQYSCIKCLQLAGSPDSLISHANSCPALIKGSTSSSSHNHEAVDQDEEAAAAGQATTPFGCFLCEKVFSSATKCQLHLDHTHTRWVNRDEELHPQIQVQDLPSVSRLQDAGIKAAHGFYCSPCDSVIDVYPLYYLHMANLHNQEKVFQCKVSSCSQRFRGSEDLLLHMNETSHPQASVMEDTLGAICCHFCDMYFKDRKEFELHHLTDQHAERMPSISDTKSFVAGRQEARNWKCKTCHTWFGLTDSFVYHMEHETHKHACPYCGIDFALPSSRRTHIQSHHQEKTDFCEVCGLKQGSKERVVAHLVTHDVVFECNTCMKKFYQREQLNSHSETHGPAVECRWTGCNKKVNPASLTAHIKQHRIEKNSKCLQCNKVFASKPALEAHKEVHARAEQSARAILSQSAANVAAKAAAAAGVASAPVNSSPPDTTVISITTPTKANTASHNSRSRSKGNTPAVNNSFSNSNSCKSEIPEGLRVMCCTCNQLFNSQTELFSHKCSLAGGVNGKGRKTASGDHHHQQQQVASNSLTDSMTENDDSSSGNRSSRGKTYSGRSKVQQQQSKTTPAAPVAKELIQSDEFMNQQSAGGQQTLTQQLDPNVQTYLLEQPDGQVMEIQCPIGMDINDVLASLQLQQQQQPQDENVPTISIPAAAADSSSGIMTMDASAAEAAVLGVDGESGGLTDGQQLIYIPVNEDGSYAIDPASLAMLTAAASTTTAELVT